MAAEARPRRARPNATRGCGPLQRGEAGPHRRPGETDFSLSLGQPQRRQAGRAGDPQVVARLRPGAGQRLPLRHFAEHGRARG
jgi:hypothetical protein